MAEADQRLPSPHGEALGLTVVKQGGGRATVSVPYNPELVGDPDSGVIHGGVLTTMLDNASGMSIRSAEELDGDTAIATLDLRIDYMRSATPFTAIIAEAECYKRTKNVAFVRGVAYQTDKDDPVATSVATFMLGTPNQPRLT
ncbi:MAG: PaaI family thioesterase [bacterium]